MKTPTKTMALSVVASALMLGGGVVAFAHGTAPAAPEVVEGAGKPILLGRMVVTATALPAG